MKFKKIFPVLVCSAMILAGGAVLATESLRSSPMQAKATDHGEVVFTETSNSSTVNCIYGVDYIENEIPVSWDIAYAPVDENSGTFINGVRVGTEIKKPGDHDYYIPVPGVTVGTVVTVKGTWSSGADTFTVREFVRQWNGTKWDYALADYDVVSLEDANMPDFTTGNINTEDDANYEYTTDGLVLPTRKGYFGLSNNTGSYGFEFISEITGTMTNWADFRIGARGGWNTGHLLQLKYTNIWNDGVVQVKEFVGNDIYDGHDVEFRTDVETGSRVLEFGAIKVLGYETKHFVYFKNNGTIAWSAYWDLHEDPRTTRVGIYAPDTNISITNSIGLIPSNQISVNQSKSSSTLLYLSTGIDIVKPVIPWETSQGFIPVDHNGIKLNGTSITSGHWNYFKKSESTELFLDLGILGVSNPVEGDLLYIGGMFKFPRKLAEDPVVFTLFKLLLADHYFEFDGEKWVGVDPDYLAEDFAKDLLEETLPICSASNDNNHDALADVWSTMANSNHYGKLTIAEKAVLTNADADGTIVVPTTVAGIDEMDGTLAIKAAMYRYEQLTAKYSLNQFITGRTISPSNIGINALRTTNHSDIIIIVLSILVVSLCGIGIAYFYSHKRKEER